VLPTSLVLFNQLRVWKFCLRIFVESLLIGMRGRGIQIEVALFDIFAVVPLVIRETKEALLQNRILPIPERGRESQTALSITETKKAIFAPTIYAAARVIVWKVFPAISICRIILTHRPPLAFRKIRSPSAPVLL